MIFTRSIPNRLYSDYTQNRPLLRQDFRFRCAYCRATSFFWVEKRVAVLSIIAPFVALMHAPT
jgi:hypothetical protein